MNPLVQARAALEIFRPGRPRHPAAKVSVASRDRTGWCWSGGMTTRNARRPACCVCRLAVRGDDHAEPVSPLR